MNHYIKLSKFIVAAMLIFSVSCTKDFDALNTNPALVTKDIVQPSLIFSGVLKNSIFASYNNGVITEYSGYYSNQESGTIFRSREWSSPFADFYKSYLINIAEVVRLTADDPALNDQHAMARIWKVWLFHMLTDAYGDLPYFEAVQESDKVNNQPVYDSQETIYKDMLKELKEAAAQLGAVPDQLAIGSADFLFGGNTDAWKRFANSLRLRLSLRVSYADESLARENIAELTGAPLITDNTQNAKMTTLGAGAVNVNDRNPLYNRYVNQSFYPMWASFTTTDNLIRLNDPRLPVYADPAADGVSGYRGRPVGLETAQKPRYTEAQTATLDEFFWSAQYSIIVMNAAEVFFLRAEAALRGLSSEDAQDLYEQGIAQALQQYNITPATYLASPAGTLAGSEEEKLEQIIVQKWLAIYYQSNEAWAEFRRTGYPRIWVGADISDTGGNIPRRVRYPLDEYAKNEENVKAAVAKLSDGDVYMSKVWWDKKAGLPFYHPRQNTFPPEQP
ncbi:MAG TPA: SusD/RagB family nutrient-binding outer membrane lipoprotein [Flavitalea sp.]|nr:SusD/RagB family nutrient-binding outer membrane lipoprotein [Flavitalea sp.]